MKRADGQIPDGLPCVNGRAEASSGLCEGHTSETGEEQHRGRKSASSRELSKHGSLHAAAWNLTYMCYKFAGQLNQDERHGGRGRL